MSAEDNKAVVRRFFDEVCNERKLGVADELFATNHTYHDPSNPSVGQGPEGMKQLMSTYQTGFPDAHWSIDAMRGTEAPRSLLTEQCGLGRRPSVFLPLCVRLSVHCDFRADSSACLTRSRNSFNSFS
jgi:hypothetical protein